MKIYHVADLHLGRRRLDGRLPDQDFADAFQEIAQAAINDRADLFVIAGDLFDRPQVEPTHLRQAQAVLRLLKQAGIKVIAIEGNHDKQFIHDQQPTWVHFLGQEDLLILLRPQFNADGAVLMPWDQKTRDGAWIDVDGVRFVGAGYLGAATPNKVRQILSKFEPGRRHVLLLHAGPDYFVGEGGGFSKEDLQVLEQKVCYLALGHIHKPMKHGNWACNPGSPENCDLREAGYSWDQKGQPVPRGYAVVEIDPSVQNASPKIEVRSNTRRACHRIKLDCTPFGNKTKNGAEALTEAAVKAIKQSEAAITAVIDLMLTGELNLNRIALDQQIAAEEIGRSAGVYAVSIDTSHLNVGGGIAPGESTSLADVPRDELERRSIRELVENENVWGLDESRVQFAELFYDLKEGVRLGRSVEEIAEQIRMSPLVDQIRAAKRAATAVPAATSHESGQTSTGAAS